jgi:hypothetical protein
MTITQDSSAPLFVVVGSTGTQGRSGIKALEESSKPYRVRAITRDTTRPAAQELEKIGCEVVKADVEDVESLKEAFEGATYAFLMTNSDYTDQSPEFEHASYPFFCSMIPLTFLPSRNTHKAGTSSMQRLLRTYNSLRGRVSQT